ncbi:hypothetical protein CI610_03558 [invertebrate metagenome]|uniref:Uncharacterized protein n=1 Tax=invertebrate metagenome TaxID=1711999 RepID=A0A2H9T2R2_9ZZZZ
MAVTDREKAEVLAIFFSSVFTKEPPGALPEFENRNPSYPFKEIVCNQNVVEKLLGNLNENKSQGPDRMHPKILKEIRNNISSPLADILNKSLSEGKLPQAWKEANITAIYKKRIQI